MAASQHSKDLVYRLYRQLFNRDPDPQGWEFWARYMDRGHSWDETRHNMASSPSGQVEIQQRINDQYRAVLGRDVDPEGLGTYREAIATGRLTIYDLPGVLSSSDEMMQRSPGGSGAGRTPTAPPPPHPLSGIGGVKAMAQRMLDDWGLGHLSQHLFEFIQAGLQTPEEWKGVLYDRGNPLGQAVLDRFPQIEGARQNGIAPMAIDEILDYEKRAWGVVQRAGMTEVFGSDPTKAFVDQMSAGIEVTQLAERINEGYLRAKSAPLATRAAFASYFGVDGDRALAQFFLKPDRAFDEWDRKLRMAEIGGTAMTAGGMSLGQDVAETLARMGLDGRSSQQGMQQIGAARSLFQESVTETEDLTAEVEGVGAVFGTDSASAAELERRRSGRINILSGGGGLLTGQGGIGGSANR